MSQADAVRCPCGQVLAVRAADLYIIRHRGREVVTRDPEAIRCEQCRRVWRPPREPTSALVVDSQ